MPRFTGGSQWPSFRPSVANVFGIIRYDIFRQSLRKIQWHAIPIIHGQSHFYQIWNFCAKELLYQNNNRHLNQKNLQVNFWYTLPYDACYLYIHGLAFWSVMIDDKYLACRGQVAVLFWCQSIFYHYKSIPLKQSGSSLYVPRLNYLIYSSIRISSCYEMVLIWLLRIFYKSSYIFFLV